MATPVVQPGDPLQPRDFTIRHTMQPNTRGQFEQHTIVTFYLGDHGPFTFDYPPGKYTSDAVRADVVHQITELRRITQVGF
jgi:hypothetical protein